MDVIERWQALGIKSKGRQERDTYENFGDLETIHSLQDFVAKSQPNFLPQSSSWAIE